MQQFSSAQFSSTHRPEKAPAASTQRASLGTNSSRSATDQPIDNTAQPVVPSMALNRKRALLAKLLLANSALDQATTLYTECVFVRSFSPCK